MPPGTGSGPIATATATLLGWLTEAGVPARIGLPDGTPAVYVWPLAVLPEQRLRTATGTEPLRLRIRHLVTVDGPEPVASAPLDRVLEAAAEDGDFPLVVEPIDNDLWLALGLRPRLGLLVDMRAYVARTPRPVPRVRSALRMDHVPMRSMRGRVVGPGEVPLAGIRVQAAGTGTATYTDSSGHFALSGLVPGDRTRLLLSGKGLHLQAEVASATAEPVVISCDIEEV